jgi:two-component system OmpR family response regulator
MRVLLAEDDPAVRDVVFRAMREEDFDVTAVGDGASALSEALAQDYDMLVLDIGLPRLSGLDVIRVVRTSGCSVPIIVITALDSSADCVSGLDAGADDYVVKPFRVDELQARARALLRRRFVALGQRVTVGLLEYDRMSRSFRAAGAPLLLPRREADIMESLLERSEDVVRKETLMRRLSRWDQEVTANLIEVYVHRLRKRLAPLGVQIQTVRGLGYVLHAATSSPAP